MQDIVLISIPESTIENIVARAVKKAIEAAQPKIEGESADLPELLTRKQAAKMLSMDALQTLTFTVQRLEKKVEALEQKNKQHE